MSLILNGTDGLSDVDGSAATPAIRGTDTNTGIFFPAADTIAFSEGGTEAMRIDSSANVIVGNTSITGATKFEVYGNSAAAHVGIRANNAASDGYGTLWISSNGSNDGIIRGGATAAVFAGQLAMNTSSAIPITFYTNNAERMRIDSSGNVIVSGTSTSSDEATYQSGGVFVSRRASSAGTTHATFLNGGSAVGSITSNTVNTFYNISSDYRLKENATPVTTGLQTILSLNPVNFDWISKNVSDTGFLAHEFQAVIPNSVMGTKDAVDANGNPIYQQIDRSGAIPFLVAAIKELKATVDAQAARIAALENPSVES